MTRQGWRFAAMKRQIDPEGTRKKKLAKRLLQQMKEDGDIEDFESEQPLTVTEHELLRRPIRYRLDFLVDGRLDWEIDGASHESPTRRRRDALRDEVLGSLGLEVLRTPDGDVLRRNFPRIREEILDRLNRPAGSGGGATSVSSFPLEPEESK